MLIQLELLFSIYKNLLFHLFPNVARFWTNCFIFIFEDYT